MVQVWSMLASRDARLATYALQQLPQPPSTTAWITYVRCHDDIGWAISDEDARAVGLDPAAHRRFLSDFYSGVLPRLVGAGAGLPAERGRRGTGGSPARSPRSPGSRRATRTPPRASCSAHAIILAFGGLPVIWMGDELGLLNDHGLGRRPRRTPPTTGGCTGRGCRGPTSRPTPTRTASRRACGTCSTYDARCRTCTPPRPPRCGTRATPACCSSSGGTPTARSSRAANVTDREAWVAADVLHWLGLHSDDLVDALTGAAPDLHDGAVRLAPYASVWLHASSPPSA